MLYLATLLLLHSGILKANGLNYHEGKGTNLLKRFLLYIILLASFSSPDGVHLCISIRMLASGMDMQSMCA